MLEKKGNSSGDLDEENSLRCVRTLLTSESGVDRVGFNPGRDIPIIPGFEDSDSMLHDSGSYTSLQFVTANKELSYHENAKSEGHSININVNTGYSKEMNIVTNDQETNNNGHKVEGRGHEKKQHNKSVVYTNKEMPTVQITIPQTHGSSKYCLYYSSIN